MTLSSRLVQDDDLLKLDGAGVKSKLPTQVQDLVKMLFDVEQMKKTMVEFEVSDTNTLFQERVVYLHQTLKLKCCAFRLI